jgi:hypothetical protein
MARLVNSGDSNTIPKERRRVYDVRVLNMKRTKTISDTVLLYIVRWDILTKSDVYATNMIQMLIIHIIWKKKILSKTLIHQSLAISVSRLGESFSLSLIR